LIDIDKDNHLTYHSQKNASSLAETMLDINNGRFEGFKSSGKLGFIENSTLQNLILDLYQEDIPSLILSTNGLTERKKELFHFIALNRKRNADNSDNVNLLLSSDVGHNLSMNLLYFDEIFLRYSNCIRKSERIIQLIDQMYSIEDK
jgi:hypothetical protein